MRAKPTFFATPADLRAWLEEHHADAAELLVGFHKKGSGRPSITWPESVDEALCFGWIDGVRKRLDDESYTVRFTPRKVRSTWSAVNVRRVAELTELGEERERRFRADAEAWEWFASQPAWYRRAATWWVISAKREDTRERRLATLIEDSAAGRPVKPLTRPG